MHDDQAYWRLRAGNKDRVGWVGDRQLLFLYLDRRLSTTTMINLSSTVRLASGYAMPLLGFGVFRSNDAKASVLEALKAGYRSFDIVL